MKEIDSNEPDCVKTMMKTKIVLPNKLKSEWTNTSLLSVHNELQSFDEWRKEIFKSMHCV